MNPLHFFTTIVSTTDLNHLSPIYNHLTTFTFNFTYRPMYNTQLSVLENPQNNKFNVIIRVRLRYIS